MAGLTALLSACSPTPALNLLVPRGGYDIHSVAYGSDPRQKLDIYVPQGLKVPAPVLLFLYGGGWTSGQRATYKAVGQAFATKGIVTVVADYRLFPQVTYPGFVQDAALALAYVHAHVAQYGGNADDIIVAGHSAGAFNAVMLAAEPKFVREAGGDPAWIKAVIGIAGPYDFLPLTEQVYIDIFHGARNEDAMPIHHIDGKRPPMLLVAGTGDAVVDPGNSDRMAARLKRFGNQATVIHYPGIGHIGIILSLAAGFRGHTPLRQDMLDFIHAHP